MEAPRLYSFSYIKNQEAQESLLCLLASAAPNPSQVDPQGTQPATQSLSSDPGVTLPEFKSQAATLYVTCIFFQKGFTVNCKKVFQFSAFVHGLLCNLDREDLLFLEINIQKVRKLASSNVMSSYHYLLGLLS